MRQVRPAPVSDRFTMVEDQGDEQGTPLRLGLTFMTVIFLVTAGCGGESSGDDETATPPTEGTDAGGGTTTSEALDNTTTPQSDTSTSQPQQEGGSDDVGGLSGRIAWSSDRDGNREIYVLDLSDSTITRITDDPAVDLYPAWSPDGSMIAFASERDGNREIYVVGSDGSGLTRLTDNPGEDTRPAWSPDGSLIAFASQRGPANLELWVMNADGSDQARLAAGIESFDAPTWSPDGTRIAYHVEKQFGPFELAVFDLASQSSETLLEGGAEPSWSSAADTVVYTVFPALDIGIVDALSGSDEVLVTGPSTEQDPAWSPDGQMVVFWSDRDGNAELYIASPDGSEAVRLTDDPGVDRNPVWGP